MRRFSAGILLAATSGVRGACLLSIWCLGCAAGVPAVPDDCSVTVIEEDVVRGFDYRLRVLVLLDERTPLPDDVSERLAQIERVLRAGSFDGSEVGRDFQPITNLTFTVRAYDPSMPLTSAVAAEAPEGFGARATTVALVIVTTSDITHAHAGQADSLVALFERPETMVFLGVAREVLGGRLSSLATALGEATDAEMASIDDPTWEQALYGLVIPSRVSHRHPGGCLGRPLERLDDGRVRCTVTETLHPEAPFTCADLPGRSQDPTEPGRCTIDQVVSIDATAPDEPGWYYDDQSTDVRDRCGVDGQRMSLAPGVELAEGSYLHLECLIETGDCTLP